MSRNTRNFSDLDLNFIPHPVTKDLTRRTDESAVKHSIKNLILTKHYERPFHSEIGSPINELLFDLLTPMTALMIRRSVIDLISNFEPRVRLIDVEVIASPDNNSVYLNITFKIVNTERPLTLDFVLERTR
jgi:phage baseplate assembly protein W